ncbi:hypothetical protein R1sor_013797 [Riccia sorocarpa]|uniref:Protein kinase domain-containing protein n=1 Tax=Riccia sorocarpa TaxID=122646 RepID=A0ABD3H869_9MARC
MSNFVILNASMLFTGFISINCGGRSGDLEDPYTNLTWVTDDKYLEYIEDLDTENVTVRASVRLESTNPVDNAEQLKTAMVFYPGNPSRVPRSKFCYTLPVYFNETEKPRNFLLRATFPSRQLQPMSLEVDLNVYSTRFYFYVDSTYVATIELYEHEEQNIELVIVPLSNTVYVCLVPLEDRSSMPAISALELRPMGHLYPRSYDERTGGVYGPNSLQASYLVVISRFNFGGDPSSPSVRYPDDKYDRLWPAARIPSNQTSEINIVTNTTSIVVDSPTRRDKDYAYPAAMYSTAWVGANLDTNISFTANLTEKRLQNPTPTFYVSEMFYGLQDSSFRTERYIDVLADLGDGFQSLYNGLQVGGYWTWLNIRKFSFKTDVVNYIVRANASSKAAPLINGLDILGECNPIITRTLPSDAAKLTRALWMFIYCRNVTGKGVRGTLPSTLGELRRLTVLDLSNNSIAGRLPDSLGQINSLRVLNLESNNLSGVFPELDPKSFQTLEFLSFADNHLAGNLSSLVAALDKAITDLSVRNNSFTGPIPLELMNLTNLRILDLSRNNLSGKLEVDLSKLQKLETLRLNRNNFSGDVPDEIWNLPSLQTLNLNENNFTRLNLTTWYSSVTRASSFNGNKGPLQVRLLGNHIEEVFLQSLEADINVPSDTGDRRTSQPKSFILLGGNPWCERHKPKDRTLIERYLCRSDPADEFWFPPPANNGVSREVLVVVGVLCGLLVLVMSSVLIFFLLRMRRRTLELHKIQEALAKENVKPPFFNYEDIKTATHNFSDNAILGAGGFGTVYKAEMADGTILAVKRLLPTEQNTADFLTEMVNISGIKHRHLIQLKGCCVREKQRMLVYEYAENKNLAEALWGAEKTSVLSWKRRFNICLGIARGLSYLHEELQPKMVHRDIKPENILLDKDYNAKIADFGLVRPNDTNTTQITLNIGGTRGYMPPEYMSVGMVSEKLDVFSFGIVLLAIVSGRKSIDHTLPPDQIYLRDWVLELSEQKMLLKLVDSELVEKYNEEEALLVIQTALACVQMDPKRRPTMFQVVNRFTKHEDVAIDIVREINGRSLNLEGILEENTAMGPNAGSEEVTRSDERALLSYHLVESSHDNDSELSSISLR